MYFCSLWVNAIEVAEHALNNLEILEALFMHKHLANLWIYSMHIGKQVEFFIVGYTIVYSIVCFRMFLSTCTIIWRAISVDEFS